MKLLNYVTVCNRTRQQQLKFKGYNLPVDIRIYVTK